MATPSTVFTEMLSTTMRNVSKDVADNVSKNNALLHFMKNNNKFKDLDGGDSVSLPMEYAEAGNYTRFSGFDTLNINPTDNITTANYDWARIALNVTVSGQEINKNSGKSRMINLVQTKKNLAIRSANNGFSIDIYSDGSLPNQINGLANIIQSDGKGTVGGIDSSVFSFWQNKFYEVPGTNAYTGTTLTQSMSKLWMSLTRGTDVPDLISMSHDFYSVFETAQNDYRRYTNEKLANVGFANIMFKNAPVVFDENANFLSTAETAYFLNTNYLYIAQHRDAKWTADDPKRPADKDMTIYPYYWMGNLCCSNRAMQGKLLDAA